MRTGKFLCVRPAAEMRTFGELISRRCRSSSEILDCETVVVAGYGWLVVEGAGWLRVERGGWKVAGGQLKHDGENVGLCMKNPK